MAFCQTFPLMPGGRVVHITTGCEPYETHNCRGRGGHIAPFQLSKQIRTSSHVRVYIVQLTPPTCQILANELVRYS